MDQALFVVMAGGNGERLRPLTDRCPKPLLRFGPSAKVIDFTLYNCLASESAEVIVLTQYLGEMIEQHLEREWRPAFAGQGKKLWTLPSTRSAKGAFLGTADAVYQALLHRNDAPEYVVALSADHVYRMDYRPMLEWHRAHGAAATVAAVECDWSEAHRFGILETRNGGPVSAFHEKPRRLDPGLGWGDFPLASMGVYVFTRRELLRYLEQNQKEASHDFGRDLIPRIVADRQTRAYNFRSPDGSRGYWRDIGDFRSYYLAHMELLHGVSQTLYAEPCLPGIRPPLSISRLVRRRLGTDRWIYNSWISETAQVGDALIEDSVIGPDVVIEDGAVVERSLILDGAIIRKWAELDTALVGPRVEIKAEASLILKPQAQPDAGHHLLPAIQVAAAAASDAPARSPVSVKQLRRHRRPTAASPLLASTKAGRGIAHGTLDSKS
jgi:glucose-1-phosphate adenylyltransferase